MTTMMIVAVFSYNRFQLAQGIRINNIDIINNILRASPETNVVANLKKLYFLTFSIKTINEVLIEMLL